MTDEPETFEAILEALESEVKRLEQGDLALDEALAAFERGMTLAGKGGEALDAAEEKVELLVAKRAGGLETRPLDPPE